MRSMTLVLILTAAALTAGAARLAYIETTRGQALRRGAERQQTLTLTIPALRGEIIDARGRVLAGTLRKPSAFVDPSLVRDPHYAACSLAPILHMSTDEVETLLRNPPQPRFVWLRRLMPDRQADAFMDIVRQRNLDGFALQHEVERVYPQDDLAAHVLGFVGRDLREIPHTDKNIEDLRGLAGLEAAYDEQLAGIPGRRQVIVDGRRRRVRADRAALEPARDGATIVLTLDAFIQQITQDALRAAVTEHHAEWGTAVVLDAHTGEVLAMATEPTFDPAQAIPAGLADMSPAERERVQLRWRNRAVCDSYEPGSIFKPFIAACALDENLVSLNEVFVINGPEHHFGRRRIRDTHAYHQLALHEIISKSSNIGMGLLGDRCGMPRLHAYVTRFGFGQPTGIGLPGEHPGLVRDLADWNASYSPQSVPIGQEIAVTPIQVTAAFSAFANDGQLLKPRIVRGIIAADGTTLVDNSDPIVVRRVLGAETAKRFRHQALVEVVQSGTGRRAQLDDYHVFGKTGTAQVADPAGGGYLDNQYVGSFVGGAPADDPRVVALVSVYKPGGKFYYGGTVAAPAVCSILNQTLAYWQIPPEVRAEPEPS